MQFFRVAKKKKNKKPYTLILCGKVDRSRTRYGFFFINSRVQFSSYLFPYTLCARFMRLVKSPPTDVSKNLNFKRFLRVAWKSHAIIMCSVRLTHRETTDERFNYLNNFQKPSFTLRASLNCRCIKAECCNTGERLKTYTANNNYFPFFFFIEIVKKRVRALFVEKITMFFFDSRWIF